MEQEPFKMNPEANTEAFKFHQNRFEKIAEKQNKKLVNKIRGKKVGPIDVAHAEALEDDNDFEKRKSLEFKEWEKGFELVRDHLKARRDHPEGEGKKYRTMILVMPGGKKVAYSAGQLTALHDMGYRKSVDIMFGISGGAPVAAYFVAGEENGPKGTSIFAEEASDPKFFNPKRLNQVMDITHIGKPMREGVKALDQKAVLDSPTELYVAVNKKGDSKMEWVDAKTAQPDMVTALEASGNIPFFRGKGIEVNDQEFFDGGLGQIDLQELITISKATDILILPSRPFDDMESLSPSFLGNLAMQYLPKGGMPGMVRKFLQISKELRKLLEEVKKADGVNIGILWPPDARLKATTMDSDKVESSIYESARATFKAFGEEIPNIELYRSSK